VGADHDRRGGRKCGSEGSCWKMNALTILLIRNEARESIDEARKERKVDKVGLPAWSQGLTRQRGANESHFQITIAGGVS